MIRKHIAALAVAGLFSAIMPLAASALSVGVSDEVSTSIASGHLCRSSTTDIYKSGVEWSGLDASKVGQSIEGSSTTSSVVDPANSNSAIGGAFNIKTGSSAGSAGTYAIQQHATEQLTGGSQADTSIVHTVSAFSNP